MAVGPEGAAAVPEAILRGNPVGHRRGDLPLGPGAAPVGRGVDHHGHGRVAILVRAVASEVVAADVDIAEELAGCRVVRPDLLLVKERGLPGRTGDDHRRLPAGFVGHRGWGGVVQARHGHCQEPVEHRVWEGELHGGAEGGGQVRVVNAMAVAPRERSITVRRRAYRDGWVTEGDQLVLGVPGQGVDWPGVPLADGGWIAVEVGPARVRRLGPVVARIEREVNPGDPDRGRPVQTGAVVDGQRLWTALLIHEVVRARHQDVRRLGVQRHSRLVLMVLRSVAGRAPRADPTRGRSKGERRGDQQGGRRGQRRERGLPSQVSTSQA